MFKRIIKKIIILMNSYISEMILLPKLILFKETNDDFDTKNFILLDTSKDTNNLGDYIINKYCHQILESLNLKPLEIQSTHSRWTKRYNKFINKLITGTNILSYTLNIDKQWWRPDFTQMCNTCLFGVGLNYYKGKMNLYSKIYYKKFLSKTFLHAVRDSYTETVLHDIGIKNVINTSCPTMWRLTPEFCKMIPIVKSINVVTTVTDYNKMPKYDFYMLDCLLRNYTKVFIWIQGDGDLQYIKSYRSFEKLIIIPHNLNDYEHILQSENVDYIGTRLHAGIRALNEKRRTMILSVDDRANQISKDTNLPVIKRHNIFSELEKFINQPYVTTITLPQKNIDLWKTQFNKVQK